MGIRSAALGAVLAVLPASGFAQEASTFAIPPAAPHALGRVLTAGPAATGPRLLLSGGYGYTESVLGTGDAHHRLAGAVTLDERPVPWLSLALRLDGRYDAHAMPGQPTDTGLVGDPRFFVRADKAWDSGLRLGARAGVWLPGGNAPSLDLGAITPELVGIASYVPGQSAIALTANLGYRLDRSSRSVPDAARLSGGDRLALQVSAFDQVLVGLAATLGRGPAQGFVEASANLLVGTGAPGASASPLFFGAGGRYALRANLRLEAELELSASRRPDAGPAAPLVPIPPRVAFWLGLTYGFGAAPVRSPAPAVVEKPPAPAPAPPAPPPAPIEVTPEPRSPQGQIRGLVRSLRGASVVADVTVEPEKGGGEPQQLRTQGGRFQLDVAPGRYRVTIAAPGYDVQKRVVEVEENGVTVLNVDLRTER